MKSVVGLAHLGIPTNCFEKSKQFYSEIGFAVEEEKVLGETHVVFMRLGDCVIEIYESNEVALRAGAIDHIALKSTDIESTYKACKNANRTFISDGIVDIALYPKGTRYFIIQGPNNESVEFAMVNV